MSSAGFVDRVVQLDSMEDFTDQLELGRCCWACVSRRIFPGCCCRASRDLQIIIDGRRSNAGQVTLSYITAIAAELGVELARSDPQYVEPPYAVCATGSTPTLNYRWFMVPNLAASLSMIIALMITALSIARERELGTFDQLLVSPSTPWKLFSARPYRQCWRRHRGMLTVAIAILALYRFYGSFVLLFGAMFPLCCRSSAWAWWSHPSPRPSSRLCWVYFS